MRAFRWIALLVVAAAAAAAAAAFPMRSVFPPGLALAAALLGALPPSPALPSPSSPPCHGGRGGGGRGTVCVCVCVCLFVCVCLCVKIITTHASTCL